MQNHKYNGKAAFMPFSTFIMMNVEDASHHKSSSMVSTNTSSTNTGRLHSHRHPSRKYIIQNTFPTHLLVVHPFSPLHQIDQGTLKFQLSLAPLKIFLKLISTYNTILRCDHEKERTK